MIEIPEGPFEIAEACAGLRFLIASIVFGCFFAVVMYRSPLRRTLFILMSIFVPIFANGLRALGIIVLAHLEGNASAVAADHVLYGWLFFTLVIMILIGIGKPSDMTLEKVRRAAARAAKKAVSLKSKSLSLYLPHVGRKSGAEIAAAGPRTAAARRDVRMFGKIERVQSALFDRARQLDRLDRVVGRKHHRAKGRRHRGLR